MSRLVVLAVVAAVVAVVVVESGGAEGRAEPGRLVVHVTGIAESWRVDVVVRHAGRVVTRGHTALLSRHVAPGRYTVAVARRRCADSACARPGPGLKACVARVRVHAGRRTRLTVSVASCALSGGKPVATTTNH